MAGTRGNQRPRLAVRAIVAIACVVGVSAGSATASVLDAAATTSAEVGVLGQGFRLLAEDDRLSLGSRAECGLPTSCGDLLALEDPSADPPNPPPAPERRPNWLLTSLVAGGAVVGSGLNSYFDGPRQSWHFADEGWFGRYTASGGADKAAHFVDYYIISKEFANLFVVLGHKPERARWLGFGVSALTGLVTEVGDGATRYGFSYQDFVMDFGGALAAALINAAGAEDLVGFRHGFLLSDSSGDRCCPLPGFSRDYSNEIYTADLQLAGVARRLGVKIGPIKYLLLSVTYGTKGYPGGADGQRQVGFELGLNFSQMLNDLDVTRDRWWGYLLHVVIDNVRFPFTAVGFRYDLNHGRWYGPDSGNSGN
jgi:Predicted periplasmic lipoprotein (DUF2279)